MLFSSCCAFLLLRTVLAIVSALLRFPKILLPDPSPVFFLSLLVTLMGRAQWLDNLLQISE